MKRLAFALALVAMGTAACKKAAQSGMSTADSAMMSDSMKMMSDSMHRMSDSMKMMDTTKHQP
jgi:hypothetical protein